MNRRWLVPAGLAVAALIVAGCGSSGSGGGASAPNALKTAKIGGATVLTNAKGFTLYWFALDTSTTSKCNGSCATFWPPVPGPATLASGVKGHVGTITRKDGSLQETYGATEIYTYGGDSKPGQNTGNGLKLSGGVWHEVTVSGSAPAPAPSSTKSGSGGYGY